MLQDELLCPYGWLENEKAQGEHSKARKVQSAERQPGRGANICVAVQGELSESMLPLGEDHSGEKGPPDVAPVGGVCMWARGIVVLYGQLEAS
jgi:hypothetical protein